LESPADAAGGHPRPRVPRAYLAIFSVVEVAALGTWLHLGRFQWFYRDEWEFVAARKAGDLGDLFRPHNEHWTTAPILAYRLLYSVFGLRAYLPYRLLVLVLYLAAAALVFAVMLRAGVRPCIATAAASLYAFFGAGWQNIIQPFQVCFTAALVFGLVQLLLADHDGPLDRRDALGVGAGIVGLMCSGVGVSMLVIVGIAVCVRRGWRIAAVHAAPGAICFLVWYFSVGRTSYHARGVRGAALFRFVESGFRGTFRDLGQVAFVGLLLFAVLIAGLFVATSARRRSGRLAELAAPIALLSGSVVFLAITAVGRVGFGPDFARSARYVSLVAAMTIPALAVAADALVSRWRRALPVAVAIFLIGVPGNISALASAQRRLKPTYTTTRRLMSSLPRVPMARRVPRSVRPDPVGAEPVTIGWLLDAVAQHRLPAPARISPVELATDDFRLSFLQHAGVAPAVSCRTVRGPITLAVAPGDEIGLSASGIFVRPARGLFLGPALLFLPGDGTVLDVVGEPHAVNVRRSSPFQAPPRVCVGR
jgi:hypothetical protein